MTYREAWLNRIPELTDIEIAALQIFAPIGHILYDTSPGGLSSELQRGQKCALLSFSREQRELINSNPYLKTLHEQYDELK